jgi:hypothetical protein
MKEFVGDYAKVNAMAGKNTGRSGKQISLQQAS